MGYRRSLESYLNLSRRELQGLCKKYNLPANRSHVQLAKSLASFFERKNANATSSKETSGSRVKDSLHILSGPGSKPKETSYHPEEKRRDVVGAYEGRTDYSESDSYRLASNIMETVGDDRQHPQTGNQLEISSHVDRQDLKKVDRHAYKAYDTSVEVVCPYPVNRESTEEFGCCTFEPGVVAIRPLDAPDIQENTANPQLGFESHNSVTTNESQKSSPPRIFSLKMLNHPHHQEFPCRPKITIECSTENGNLSSYEVLKRAAPSLQFFAASEEGINLYVDLSSSPSEWVNSLTEVCTYQTSHQHSPKSLSDHTRGLEDVDEPIKNLVSGLGTDIQSGGVERNTGCTNSSSSSVVSENCHSEATAVTSRSCFLTPSSIPVEIPGCSEGNQVVSSSCITSSNVQNQIVANISSCLEGGKAYDSTDASLNSTGNLDVTNRNEIENPIPMDHHCLKTTVDCDNVDVNAYENHTLSTPDQIQNKKEPSIIGNPEKNITACQVSVENGLTDEIMEVICQQNRSSNSCQIGGQLVLDCPATDAQSDLGSANQLLDQHVCSSLGNSVTEDPMFIIDDELGSKIAVKEVKLTEHSEVQNSLERGDKRTHSSEFSEEFQSKRQNANSVNKSGMVVSLRSTKTRGKETVCDPVLPRRSTRLVPK